MQRVKEKKGKNKIPHLQLLDSPGASSKSQNNIFGCVEIKHRPSSPASNKQQDNSNQLFASVMDPIAYQQNPVVNHTSSEFVLSPLEGTKLVQEAFESVEIWSDIRSVLEGSFTRDSFTVHWQCICALAQANLSVSHLSLVHSLSTAWLHVWLHDSFLSLAVFVKIISHSIHSPAKKTDPRRSRAFTSIIIQTVEQRIPSCR